MKSVHFIIIIIIIVLSISYFMIMYKVTSYLSRVKITGIRSAVRMQIRPPIVLRELIYNIYDEKLKLITTCRPRSPTVDRLQDMSVQCNLQNPFSWRWPKKTEIRPREIMPQVTF